VPTCWAEKNAKWVNNSMKTFKQYISESEEQLSRRGFLRGLAAFAASAAVPAPVVKLLSTPAGVATLPVAAGIALLKGIQEHLNQFDPEDDDDYYEAWESMADELGFEGNDDEGIYPTDQLSQLLDLNDQNPELAAAQLIKHIQSGAGVNPEDVKAAFVSRADDPSDWRYQRKQQDAKGVEIAQQLRAASLRWRNKGDDDDDDDAGSNQIISTLLGHAADKFELDINAGIELWRQLAAQSGREGFDDAQEEIYLTLQDHGINPEHAYKATGGAADDVSDLAKIARLAGVAKGVGSSNNQAPAPTVKHMGPVQYAKDAPALPAPAKPEFDLAPDLKQKQKVPVKKDDDRGVAEGSLNEFAPGGDGGNGPFDYGTAIIRIGEDYIEHYQDYPEGSGEDAAAIIQVGKTFVSRGMQAGIAALFDLDTFVSDHVLDNLSDQGFNVKADIINKRREVKLTSKEKGDQRWNEYQAMLAAKPGEWYRVTGHYVNGGTAATDIKATSAEEAKKEFLATKPPELFKQVDAKLKNSQHQGFNVQADANKAAAKPAQKVHTEDEIRQMILSLLQQFTQTRKDPEDQQEIDGIYKAFQSSMQAGFATLRNAWENDIDADFTKFARQHGIDLNAAAAKYYKNPNDLDEGTELSIILKNAGIINMQGQK